MKISELQDFVKSENERLKNHLPPSDHEKSTYAHLAKIMEELGELSNEVLASHKRQRKEKLNNSKDNLSKEFADVIITTSLLAEHMGVDINEALKIKIEKIKARVY